MKILLDVSRRLVTEEEKISEHEEFSNRNYPNRNTERKTRFEIKNGTVLVSYEKISGIIRKSLVR